MVRGTEPNPEGTLSHDLTIRDHTLARNILLGCGQSVTIEAMPEWHPDAGSEPLELPLELPSPPRRETDGRTPRPNDRDPEDEDRAPGVIVIELV